MNMVEQQIRTWEVLDQDVLDLLYVVPREEFVATEHRALAFSDLQLPLSEGERMWEPKLEARVLQELDVRKADRVLEVGTGSGYLTALLAHRAAHVYSVELKPALAAFGRRNLERHGTSNITLDSGDAAHGWERYAPYHVIVLTGSTPVLPRAFLDQLEIGGRLFAVVGEPPVMTARLVTCTAPGAFNNENTYEKGQPSVFATAYGGGPIEYLDLLNTWRAESVEEDLQMSRLNASGRGRGG